MFFSKTLLYLLFIQYINCDCGPAGKPFGTHIYGFRSFSPEKSWLHYECENEFRHLYVVDKRTCIRGKWTGRAPKCGNY